MAKSARLAALTVLERCRRNQAFSDALIGSAASGAGLEGKDRALCSRLSYGVLQNTMLCDFYIDSYLQGTKKLEPKLRDILRITVYQLLFLDRIPVHAAINEAVELCKELGLSRASGLANAVLRKIAANCNNLPEIPREDICSYLSIKYSHPKPLVQLILDELGETEAEQLLAANNEPAPIFIQVNTLRTTGDELLTELKNADVEASAHDSLENCIELSNCGDITALKAFSDGKFYVQDPAARLAIYAAAPRRGDKVLDACSAPGGKSFATAITMENCGSILSCDIHKNKLNLVESGAKRLGIEIISTNAMDAAAPCDGLLNAFDLVIADVPCSGLGVIRKKPDIRFKDIALLTSLPEKQLSILEGLSACVKPGGVLLYSTCTFLERENGDVVSRFLSQHREFSMEEFELPKPFGLISEGSVTLYPHLHGTDGFYICKLRKQK